MLLGGSDLFWNLPQDLSPGRLRQLGIFGEVSDRTFSKLLRSFSMRIIGSHDEIIVADMQFLLELV